MQSLKERLESYSLSSVLKDYCSDLREIEARERLCPQQPIARYESDFVSVISSKELLAAFRRDFIRVVDDISIDTKDAVIASKLPEISAVKLEAKVQSLRSARNVVDEMRLMYSDDFGESTINNVELLEKLDDYLRKADSCKRGYSELLKSIPPSAFSMYEDRLKKTGDGPECKTSSVAEVTEKADIIAPMKRRGGFKRKLVSSTISDLSSVFSVQSHFFCAKLMQFL